MALEITAAWNQGSNRRFLNRESRSSTFLFGYLAFSRIVIVIVIIALRHVYRFTGYIGSNSYSSYNV